MNRTAINHLIWGLIFILFDLTIGPIDLFHDVIGYLLLYNGLNKLPSFPSFQYAKVGYGVLACYAVIATFFPVRQNFLDLNYMGNESIILSFVSGVMGLVVLFAHVNMMTGFIVLLIKNNMDQQAQSLKKFKYFYIVIHLVFTGTGLFSMVLVDWLVSAAIFLVILLVITDVILLFYIQRMKQHIE